MRNYAVYSFNFLLTFFVFFHSPQAFGTVFPCDEVTKTYLGKQDPKDDFHIKKTFSRENEFPNLFLPAKFQRKDLSKLNSQEKAELLEHVESVETLLSNALNTIFSKLTVPIVELNGSTKFSKVFAELQKKLLEVDPSVRIQPSGGVVRSSLGLIYKVLYDKNQSLGEVDVLHELHLIAEGNHPIFNKKGEISGDSIRGVGSDFDFLLWTSQPSNFSKLEEITKDLVNSAKDKFMDQSHRSNLNKSIFTIGDVKANFTIDGKLGQTERSVLQGGSTLDFLIFDMVSGQLETPKDHPNIVRDFILGTYSYVTSSGKREDHSSTVFRGVRPLLEIPFLDLKDPTALNTEINELSRDTETNSFPSSKAIEQIGKILRNARFSAAHNRIHRERPEHPLSSFRDLTQDLNQAKSDGKLKTEMDIEIPVYEFNFPLNRARKKLPKQLEDKIITANQFRSEVLQEGKLFHGASSVEGALAILRGGIRQTNYENGVRRGAYFSPKREESLNYTNKDKPGGGFLLQFDIKEQEDFRVLDLRTTYEKDANSLLQDELGLTDQQTSENLSDILVTEYGVDIILLSDTHAVVKNLGVLNKVPLESIVVALGEKISSPDLDPLEALQAYMTYKGVYPYMKSLSQIKLPEPPIEADFLTEILDRAKDESPLKHIQVAVKAQQFEVLTEKLIEEIKANASSTSWRDFELENFWPLEFTQLLGEGFLSEFFDRDLPVSKDEMIKFATIIIISGNFLTVSPKAKAIVAENFDPKMIDKLIEEKEDIGYLLSNWVGGMNPSQRAVSLDHSVQRGFEEANNHHYDKALKWFYLFYEISNWNAEAQQKSMEKIDQFNKKITKHLSEKALLKALTKGDDLSLVLNVKNLDILAQVLLDSKEKDSEKILYIYHRIGRLPKWTPAMRKLVNYAVSSEILPEGIEKLITDNPLFKQKVLTKEELEAKRGLLQRMLDLRKKQAE